MVNPDLKAIAERFPNSHVGRLLSSGNDLLPIDWRTENFDHHFASKLKEATDPKAVQQALVQAKKEVAASYARHLLTGSDDTPDKTIRLGRFWSDFADWTLQRAVSHACHSPQLSRFFKELPEPGKPVPGLFVLGLGKLGGHDLNYSSDVDLVAFFDSKLFPVREGEGKTDIAGRVLKSMTQILTGTGANQVWRVDWRLRPDPSVTGLAMSTEAGIDYYFFKSAPWRRLAMMKSRVVAGDIATGQNFMETLTPFIWRKTLDFRAIEDIGDMKTRIRNEHPDLEDQRDQDTPLTTARNFHVKLGAGGIREIEFIANALQLVWGGRLRALRTTETLAALKTLGESNHLEPDTVDHLRNAYSTLRGIENRIQLIKDGHTHTVPDDGDEQDVLLAIGGYENFKALGDQIKAIRTPVHEAFESHFSTEKTPSKSKTLAESTRKKLDAQSLEIVDIWKAGFLEYGILPETAPKLEPLHESLIDLVETHEDPSQTIRAIDAFFRLLPPGGQYLRLLAEHPQLAGDILPPLTGSGAMANLLRLRPHVVDTLIQRNGRTMTTPDERRELAKLVTNQSDYGSQLEALRAHVNEMLYLVYLCAWRGECKPDLARNTLSDIASETLEQAMVLVEGQGAAGSKNISVIGFGKLGMRQMMPESDLDIVFLAHGKDTLELDDVQSAHRFSDRLKTALAAEMRGGKAYEIDTRLRPSGQSGAPTVRLSTFFEHQMERAKTWEHLALVPARFICGPEFARKAFDDVRQNVLTRPRDKQALANDAHGMLAMLNEHRITRPKSKTIALKLMPGGLMHAEYLLSFATLKMAASNPELAKADFHDLPELLEKADPAMAGFAAALGFLQDAHFCERLYGWTDRKLTEADIAASPLDFSLAAFLEELGKHTTLIGKLISKLITEPSSLGPKSALSLEPGTVLWQDA